MALLATQGQGGAINETALPEMATREDAVGASNRVSMPFPAWSHGFSASGDLLAGSCQTGRKAASVITEEAVC